MSNLFMNLSSGRFRKINCKHVNNDFITLLIRGISFSCVSNFLIIEEKTEYNLQWCNHRVIMENKTYEKEYERHSIYGIRTNCIRQCPQKENFENKAFTSISLYCTNEVLLYSEIKYGFN